ncbi:MAG: VOC family protein, partial [Desulfofustis sp.]|nr:VOC family protein [Desulfofustis sp.]
MNNRQAISGIHHITAISSSATDNVAFYEDVLGLRLVKQTVNFDDPYTYHLYYGDQHGTPGTILTFFPWSELPRGTTGAGMVTAIAFAIPAGSPDYWRQRLQDHQVATTSGTRFGDEVISFADPDGLTLELIAPQRSQQGAAADHAIQGFHSATELTRSLAGTQELLVASLGMELHAQEHSRYRFAMTGDESPARFYDLVVDPQAIDGRQGAGTVHHIAFRTPTNETQLRWQHLLREDGYQVTAVRDRKYFKSIYFHEPGGVLFEIATDPPGFTVDEPLEKLGHALQLPEQFESWRDKIVGGLPPLRQAAFVHRFVAAPPSETDGTTIVTLHGTGGDEHDLIPLAREVSGEAAILSPRGQVREDGMNRFFKRLSAGVFDEEDLTARAHQLADFLRSTAAQYRRSVDQLVALGYSNGANMAAALLFLRPETFSRAILLRPMLPLGRLPSVDLSDKEVLILRGTADTVIPTHSTDQLIKALTDAGARLEVREIAAGHELTPQDLEAAAYWLAEGATPHPAR